MIDPRRAKAGLLGSADGKGLLGSSDGKAPEVGVLILGNLGLGDLGDSSVGELVELLAGASGFSESSLGSTFGSTEASTGADAMMVVEEWRLCGVSCSQPNDSGHEVDGSIALRTTVSPSREGGGKKGKGRGGRQRPGI